MLQLQLQPLTSASVAFGAAAEAHKGGRAAGGVSGPWRALRADLEGLPADRRHQRRAGAAGRASVCAEAAGPDKRGGAAETRLITVAVVL